MRILIVDDHILYREGLASLLANQSDLTVVGEAGSVREAIDKALDLKPDLVLMDITLPDGTGVDALRAIVSRQPEIKVVMLTIHETEDLLLSAIRNGAAGYLLKNISSSKLILSLRALQRGENALSRTMISSIVSEFQRMGKVRQNDSGALNLLTPREVDVLKMLGDGAINEEIAGQMFISKNTVKVHIHNILSKLGFRSRQEAAEFARRNLLSGAFSDPPVRQR